MIIQINGGIMEKIKKVVNKYILEILELTGYEIDTNENTKLIDDLGFSSLDLAELIASLELELEVAQFSNSDSISSVVTLNDLYNIYSKYVRC